MSVKCYSVSLIRERQILRSGRCKKRKEKEKKRALLTARDEVSAFRVCGKTGDSIQVSHHRVDNFACKDIPQTTN